MEVFSEVDDSLVESQNGSELAVRPETVALGTLL